MNIRTNINVCHLFSIFGAILLHLTLFFTFITPAIPKIIPAEQVINVSLVAPTIIKNNDVIKKETNSYNSIIPAKEKGMFLKDSKKSPSNKIDAKPKISKSDDIATTQLSSGIESAESKLLDSAMSEPSSNADIKNPPPKYPNSARIRKQEGTVMLEVLVSKSGSPTEVTIHKSSGFPVLDDAALDAVREWQFLPAKKGKEIIEASVIVPIEFRIKS